METKPCALQIPRALPNKFAPLEISIIDAAQPISQPIKALPVSFSKRNPFQTQISKIYAKLKKSSNILLTTSTYESIVSIAHTSDQKIFLL